MAVVARYPDSAKASLEHRLRARASERWPKIAARQQWQFAIYRASHDDYHESIFATGLPVGVCQDALATACGLYLNDPAAWA
jgi:hypothetical protein